MKLSGYANPMRSFERRMNPGFPSHQMGDPGLSHTGMHTMPHLQRLSGIRLQGGGSLDPTGELYASSRPNYYNPDPMRRRVLALQQQMAGQFRNPNLSAFPLSTSQLPYAEGGALPDPEELMESDDNLSPEDQQLKGVVMDAILALEGQNPDPKEAIQQFIEIFGRDALGDLQQMVAEERQKQPDEEEEEEEEEEPPEEQSPEEEEEEQSAGGGLLRGPGTGQSDEIEARTPSGRPVLLSDGEYVIDAPTVAALGDGSTNAGARRLDDLRKQIRKSSYGSDRQAKPMKKGGAAIVVKLGK